jgi:hypothetical protein
MPQEELDVLEFATRQVTKPGARAAQVNSVPASRCLRVPPGASDYRIAQPLLAIGL